MKTKLALYDPMTNLTLDSIHNAKKSQISTSRRSKFTHYRHRTI
jgi:hypothetical protein